MQQAFFNCTAFAGDLSGWTTTVLNRLQQTFNGCTNFNSNISGWNVSSVTTFQACFSGCTSFNQDLSTWNVSSGTNFISMFNNCQVFNANISGWNITSSVTGINEMLRDCFAFNQDLGSWDYTGVTSLSNFVEDTALSSANYNSLLAKLKSDSAGAGITFGMTLGANGLIATGQGVLDRLDLIDDDSMTFIDSTPEPHTITVVSNNFGSSANNQFQWPVKPTRSADYVLRVTNDTAADIAITLDTDPSTFTFVGGVGTYNIIAVPLSGQVTSKFNNGVDTGGDKSKITDVSAWGAYELTNAAYYGCDNLDVTATDQPEIFDSNLTSCFRFCTSLVGSTEFNNWDLSGVPDLNNMFRGATAFTKNITLAGTLSPSAAAGIENLFRDTTALNVDISNTDYTVVDSLNNYLRDAGLDSTNYNAVLAKLRSDAGVGGTGITSGMTFRADGLVATGQGVTDKSWLITNTSMIITDATP
jgi:surface protein